jgi:hypothetical protein
MISCLIVAVELLWAELAFERVSVDLCVMALKRLVHQERHPAQLTFIPFVKTFMRNVDMRLSFCLCEETNCAIAARAVESRPEMDSPSMIISISLSLKAV